MGAAPALERHDAADALPGAGRADPGGGGGGAEEVLTSPPALSAPGVGGGEGGGFTKRSLARARGIFCSRGVWPVKAPDYGFGGPIRKLRSTLMVNATRFLDRKSTRL